MTVPDLLSATGLHLALPDRTRTSLLGRPPLIDILKGIDVSLAPGEALGVVGESGSGKSTLGRTLLRIYTPQRGNIIFDGIEIADAPETAIAGLRLRMQMIFQDSQSSLNPRQRILDILAAPFIEHGIASGRAARDRAMALLERVGLDQRHAQRYPHQLSGGQRQRVGIARALAMQPKLIIADEIVSGLDVSVQAQIIALLRTLRAEENIGLIFISHDLSVVRSICDRVAVMRSGEIVETGACADVFAAPQHAYTRALLRAIPLPVVDPQWLQIDGGDPLPQT
ncbi:ATP-binding cassette domain-containing protein [Roseiarcaceae bacterium H3SJ34-1]|uniref:ATP-binding cassette domain-containing protein n=1 Tax=Terripilifer ovatus TaxID=3032367 RepID=UPI003AB94BAF|nr:ATP-binding cassette domain-containing protein [Roseiarcaceae bacterium H3SJ34-1]